MNPCYNLFVVFLKMHTQKTNDFPEELPIKFYCQINLIFARKEAIKFCLKDPKPVITPQPDENSNSIVADQSHSNCLSCKPEQAITI